MLRKAATAFIVTATAAWLTTDAQAQDIPAAPLNAGPPAALPGVDIIPGLGAALGLVNGVTQPILQPVLAPGAPPPVAQPVPEHRWHHWHHHVAHRHHEPRHVAKAHSGKGNA